MHVFWICLVLYTGSSFCINDIEYERIYEDSYDNEIPLDQQEGEFYFFVFFFLSAPCLFEQIDIVMNFSPVLLRFTKPS